jgi:predicted DNA-binding transcriptional regulator AlpA
MHDDYVAWSVMMAVKFLNRAGLAEKGIDYSPSQLNRKMNDGSFPQAVKGVSQENAWLEEEIDQYLADRIAARARRTRPPLIPAAGTARRA